MASQEQVSKQNTYVITGPPTGDEGVSKVTIYAIVNTLSPPPPPPPYLYQQSQIFIGRKNS